MSSCEAVGCNLAKISSAKHLQNSAFEREKTNYETNVNLPPGCPSVWTYYVQKCQDLRMSASFPPSLLPPFLSVSLPHLT